MPIVVVLFVLLFVGTGVLLRRQAEKRRIKQSREASRKVKDKVSQKFSTRALPVDVTDHSAAVDDTASAMEAAVAPADVQPEVHPPSTDGETGEGSKEWNDAATKLQAIQRGKEARKKPDGAPDTTTE